MAIVRHLDKWIEQIPILRNNKRLLTGAAVVYVLQIMGVGTAYIAQVFLARWMGVQDFGDYSLAYNWARLLALFGGLGLTLSALKFVPDYLESQDWARLRGVIYAFSALTLLGGSVLAIGAVIIFTAFPLNDVHMPTLIAGLLMTPVMAVTFLYVEILRGMGKIAIAYGPLNVGQNVLLFVIGGGVFLLAGDLVNIEAITILGVSLLVIAIYQFIAIIRALPVAARGIKASYDLLYWMRVSLPMLFIRGFLIINQRLDILMIGFLLGSIPTGIYAVASRTANLLSFALSSVSAITAPRISPLYNQGKLDELEKLLKRSTMIAIVVSTLVFIVMVLFSYWLLWVFGEEFVVGQTTLIILAFGQLVNAVFGQCGYVMHLTGNQMVSTVVFGVSAFLNIALNLFFIQTLDMGLEGVAYATAITMVVQNLWMYIAVRRYVGINPLPIG
jgi:O-antigen/teichoic acid export membrane protein